MHCDTCVCVPHLAKRWEPRGFSRVAAAFSSYDGDLSLPLGLALGSPIFPSGCEGEKCKLGALFTLHMGTRPSSSPSGAAKNGLERPGTPPAPSAGRETDGKQASLVLGITEGWLFSVMAYDRYVAICYPLRYKVIMSPWLCGAMVVFCGLWGVSCSLVYTVFTMRLPY